MPIVSLTLHDGEPPLHVTVSDHDHERFLAFVAQHQAQAGFWLHPACVDALVHEANRFGVETVTMGVMVPGEDGTCFRTVITETVARLKGSKEPLPPLNAGDRPYGIEDFFRDAKRLNLTADDIVPRVRARLAQRGDEEVVATPRVDTLSLKDLMTGFRIADRGVEDPVLTPEAAQANRWMVERSEAPFCTEDDRRVWTGATPEEALTKARLALGLPL